MNRLENEALPIGSVSVWLAQLPLGELGAQAAIFRRFEPFLVRYAAYRLRQMNVRECDADDIVQQTFAGLFRRAANGSLPELTCRKMLNNKLKQICNDRVKDARRRRIFSTESAFGLDHDKEVIGMTAIIDGGIDECIEALELSLFQAHLATQHEDLPVVANLKMQGYSVREIAEKMGVGETTIRRRLTWIYEIFEEYQGT